MTFKRGDTVCNEKSPQIRYRGKTGTFIALLPGSFYGRDDEQGIAVVEPACDVLYVGECGPYDYPYVAQRVSVRRRNGNLDQRSTTSRADPKD